MGIIKKQGAINSIITYIGIVIGFLNLLIIQPLFLSPEELGLTRVLFSFSALIASIFPLGIGNLTIRYFPKFRNPASRHNGFFGLMMLFPISGYIITAAILYLFRDYFIGKYAAESPLFAEYFFSVFPFCLILGLITTFNVYCFAIFKTTLPSFLNDIFVRIVSILVFSLYFLKLISLNQMIILFIGGYGLQLSILGIYMLLIGKPGFKINKTITSEIGLGNMIKYGLFLTLGSFSSLSLKYLDSVMLVGMNISLSMVGVYAVAAFVPTIIEAPVGAVEKISNAKISEHLNSGNLAEIEKIYKLSVRYFLLFGGLLFLGVNLSITDLLHLLPEPYHQGSMVVWIISLSALINMATGVNNAIIFNSAYYKTGTYLLYLLVVLAVIFNVIFIPRFGLEGAALATTLSGLVYNVVKWLVIYRKFGLQPYNSSTLKIILTIVLVGVLIYWLPLPGNEIVRIALRSVLITLSYISLSIALGIIPKNLLSIKELKSLIK